MSLEQYNAEIDHYIQQAGADWVIYAMRKKWKLAAQQQEVLS